MTSSYRRRSGDRKEGRLLRSLPAFNKFIPFIMPQRSDACNFYEESYEVTDADKCLRAERVSGYKGMSFLHFFIAAYIRCVSMLPGVNRFCLGRRIYARDSIEVVLTIKRSLAIEASDATVKVRFEPTDTIFDVYRKINDKIDEVKSDSGSGAEDIAETLSRAPRFFLKIVFFILKVLDNNGKLPQKLLDASPFHASMSITDAGSLRVGPVFNQLPSFGTLPVSITFGSKRHVYELDRHGETVDHKYLDAKFTLDERICDRRYYAQFLQAMRYIFAHPEILEHSPTRVVEDVG